MRVADPASPLTTPDHGYDDSARVTRSAVCNWQVQVLGQALGTDHVFACAARGASSLASVPMAYAIRSCSPLSAAARRAIAADPALFEIAATGGDDYELLAAVAPASARDFEAAARADSGNRPAL